jgi:FtsH-binding integral membrane protein
MYQRSPQTRAASAPAMLGQVLGLTAVGFMLTAVGAYLFPNLPPTFGFIAMLVGFGLIYAMQAAIGKNAPLALVLFYVFTFVMGIGIAPIIAAYVRVDGTGVIIDAATATGLGMAVLGGVAYVFGVDWRRFSGIAVGALVILIVAELINLFVHFLHPTWISWAVLAIFTFLTLGDFSRIRAAQPWESPIQLAVSIYLDALNIFLAFLQIFGNRRN